VCQQVRHAPGREPGRSEAQCAIAAAGPPAGGLAAQGWLPVSSAAISFRMGGQTPTPMENRL